MENLNHEETVSAPEQRDIKIIFKILIGLFAGFAIAGGLALIPFVGMLCALFMAVSVLIGLLVFGIGDLWSAGCFMLANEAMSMIIGGPLLASLYLLAVNLPVAFTIGCMKQGTPFYKTLIRSLIAQAAGLIAAVGLLLIIYGPNLGDLATEFMSKFFAQLPVETREALANTYTSMYQVMGLSFTVTETDEVLKAICLIMGEVVKTSATQAIVLLSVINALPGTLISCFIRTRRNVSGASYEAVSGWRIPVKVSIGLIVLIVFSLILSKVNVNGDLVLMTILIAGICACNVQFYASTYDRLSLSPMRTGGKIALLIISTLLAESFVILYGALSMIIGSHGIVKYFKKDKPDNNTI